VGVDDVINLVFESYGRLNISLPANKITSNQVI